MSEKLDEWAKPYAEELEEIGKQIRKHYAETDQAFLTKHDDDANLAAIYFEDALMSVSYNPRMGEPTKEVEQRGAVKCGSRWFFRWHHRKPASNLKFDMDNLKIDREGLHHALAQYLKVSYIQTEYFDDWFADTVCYQEISAFAFHVEARNRLTWIPGGASRKERKRNAQLLEEMLAAYQVLESGVYSWEVFWAELNRTRELGAVWPGELYRLVELRKSP